MILPLKNSLQMQNPLFHILVDRAGVAPAVFLRHGFTDRCLRFWAHLSITIPTGLEPGISGLKGLCLYHWTMGPYRGSRSRIRLVIFYAVTCTLTLPSTTKMSSIDTSNTAANTTRLSMVGNAVPCCHL